MDETTPAPKTEIARRLPRHETNNRVVLTVPKPDGPEKVSGRACNISEAGFGAVLAGELEIGDVVQARLVLQAMSEALEVTAQVKNRHGFTHGFQFMDITTEQRRAIMRYLRAASNEDAITVQEAQAMNTQHASDPHGKTGKFRFSADAWAPKPDGHGGTSGENIDEKKEDGGE